MNYKNYTIEKRDKEGKLEYCISNKNICASSVDELKRKIDNFDIHNHMRDDEAIKGSESADKASKTRVEYTPIGDNNVLNQNTNNS